MFQKLNGKVINVADNDEHDELVCFRGLFSIITAIYVIVSASNKGEKLSRSIRDQKKTIDSFLTSKTTRQTTKHFIYIDFKRQSSTTVSYQKTVHLPSQECAQCDGLDSSQWLTIILYQGSIYRETWTWFQYKGPGFIVLVCCSSPVLSGKCSPTLDYVNPAL